MGSCLIFVPFGQYDEPEILRYAITSMCPKGADVRQDQAAALYGQSLDLFSPFDDRGETHEGVIKARYGYQVPPILKPLRCRGCLRHEPPG
jgi:hypothetical protein